MTEKKVVGRPKKETDKRTLRIPSKLLEKAEEKADKLGLNFQQYTLLLISKDVNNL